MLAQYSDKLIASVPGLKDFSAGAARSIHHFLTRSEATRDVADVLHGKWLGHPLHPVLTDVVIGAWSFAAVFDLIAKATDSPPAEQAADVLVAIGAGSALPTAIAGVTDFSTIPSPAAPMGALHGLLNTAGLGLYLASLWQRNQGSRNRGIWLSLLGLGVMTVSAYLGGEMVYQKRVGVNHNSERHHGPEDWTPVLAEHELTDGTLRRVEVQGEPVLLFRSARNVYAIGAVCSHAGGPLEQGNIVDGFCVECPWHDSVYDLRDGTVRHGPSTYDQPRYDVRLRDGQIYLRAPQSAGEQAAPARRVRSDRARVMRLS